MNRATNKQLENQLKQLPELTTGEWNFSQTAQGIMLVIKLKNGGERSISQRMTKTQMYNFLYDLNTILYIIEREGE